MRLVEAYQRCVTAFNERDLEAWLDLMDEDVDVESRFSRVGANFFRGHEAVRQWWADLDEAWEFIRVELEVVAQIAPDETLALIQLVARGRESGLDVREPAAHRVRWRKGKYLHLRYEDRAAAERELSASA